MDNVVADAISRPDELFSPPLTQLYTTPYPTLITQVCRQYKEKRHWELFLPSVELKSALNSALSCDFLWERPKKPQNNGQFVLAERISSNGPHCEVSTHSCFL